MSDLRVTLGCAARDALCSAIHSARASVIAEFHVLGDRHVIASLNAAAARGVHVEVCVEGDVDRYDHPHKSPVSSDSCAEKTAERLRKELSSAVHLVVETDADVLMHAKAAVVDGDTAFIATANPSWSGLSSPGEVLVEDRAAADVQAIVHSFQRDKAGETEPQTSSAFGQVVAGPSPAVRANVERLLESEHDIRLASEDLSDPDIVERLKMRRLDGHHDRVLVDTFAKHMSPTETQALNCLRLSGVLLRSPAAVPMHEKYLDDGDAIYVGSANLTRNGLEESREIGIVAPSTSFGEGAAALRADFDRTWALATPY
ncbi:MAG: hypothetical protein DLM53_04255 [Candidatus Eremiobacter antarcticus]|nr:MAG: hypothetical protein DLM53_04255 [Candidatus Eremiobacter sp. RRmetagenome_bin22]